MRAKLSAVVSIQYGARIGCSLVLVLASLARLLEANPSTVASPEQGTDAVSGASWVGLPCDRKLAVKSSLNEAMSQFEADPLEIIKLGKEQLLKKREHEKAQRDLEEQKRQLELQLQVVPMNQEEPSIELKGQQAKDADGGKKRADEKQGRKKRKGRKKRRKGRTSNDKKNNNNKPLPEPEPLPECTDISPAKAGAPSPSVCKLNRQDSHGKPPMAGPIDHSSDSDEEGEEQSSGVVPATGDSVSGLHEHLEDEHEEEEVGESEELQGELDADSSSHVHEEEPEASEEHMSDYHPANEFSEQHHYDAEDSHSVVTDDHLGDIHLSPQTPDYTGSQFHQNTEDIEGEHTSPSTGPMYGRDATLLPGGPPPQPPASLDTSSYHDHPGLSPSDGSEMHHHWDVVPYSGPPTRGPTGAHIEEGVGDNEEQSAESNYMDNFSELPGYGGSLPEVQPESSHNNGHYNGEYHSRRQFAADSDPQGYEIERNYVDNEHPGGPYQVHEKQFDRRHKGPNGGWQKKGQSIMAHSLNNPRNIRRRQSQSMFSYSGHSRAQSNRGRNQRAYAPIFSPLTPLTPLTTFTAVQPAIIYESRPGVPAMQQHSTGRWASAAAYAGPTGGYAAASAPLAFATTSHQPAGYYTPTGAYAGVPLLYGDHFQGLPNRYPRRRMSKGQRYRANKRARQAAASSSANINHY